MGALYTVHALTVRDEADQPATRYRVLRAGVPALALRFTAYATALAVCDALNAAFRAGQTTPPPGRDPHAAPYDAWPFRGHRTLAEVIAAENADGGAGLKPAPTPDGTAEP